ncbi:MAG: DNA repair protein RecO [Candidatus Binatia bacterium]
MHEERTVAIVLRSRPHGESDKIVTFLTRDWGKVSGIAKGAKRSRRRFVNVLESFTHVQLRFRPGRTEELAFIFGCDLIRSFRSPSRDLHRFALASYIVELIDVMIAGREAGQEAYTLLLQSLTVLEEHVMLSPLFLPAFELLLLAHAGYEPHLATCQQCAVHMTGEETPLVFSPSLGGLLCPRCRGQGGATLLLTAETLHVLRTSKSAGLASFLAMPVSPRVYREARMLVTRLLSQHLSRPLKSLAFLEQAGFLNDAHVDAPQGE